MSDIISQIQEKHLARKIKFRKSCEDAVLPKCCKRNSSLFILSAVDNYTLRAASPKDATIEIRTGVEIEYAQNVEITAFAPMFRNFDDTFIVKQSEIDISPNCRSELSFRADQIFRAEFLSPWCTNYIEIHKGDLVCYMRIAPAPQVWVEGIDV